MLLYYGKEIRHFVSVLEVYILWRSLRASSLFLASLVIQKPDQVSTMNTGKATQKQALQ